MTLDQARDAIGAAVTYRPPFGRPEQGVITSVNDHYVFVRYSVLAENGTATHPDDLVFNSGRT